MSAGDLLWLWGLFRRTFESHEMIGEGTVQGYSLVGDHVGTLRTSQLCVASIGAMCWWLEDSKVKGRRFNRADDVRLRVHFVSTSLLSFTWQSHQGTTRTTQRINHRSDLPPSSSFHCSARSGTKTTLLFPFVVAPTNRLCRPREFEQGRKEGEVHLWRRCEECIVRVL